LSITIINNLKEICEFSPMSEELPQITFADKIDSNIIADSNNNKALTARKRQ